VLLLISVLTVASGLGQLARPDLILRLIGGEASPTAVHSFGIVGMFMVLFGGMLLQALLTAGDHSVAVLWAGLQKFGAAGAVGLGVIKGIFSPLALGVALFDLLSGVLIFAYRARTRAAGFRIGAPATARGLGDQRPAGRS
jgi:hypothetical protein